MQGGLPVQRACQAVGLSRATYYRPVVDWAHRDAAVMEALTMLGATKPRWGFWKYVVGSGTPDIGGTTSGCGASIASYG